MPTNDIVPVCIPVTPEYILSPLWLRILCYSKIGKYTHDIGEYSERIWEKHFKAPRVTFCRS